MNEQWLSIIEYARMHDISDMTVRRRIKKGKISAVLKDGKYYIPLSAESSHMTATNIGYETPSAPLSAMPQPAVMRKNISVPNQRSQAYYQEVPEPMNVAQRTEVQRPAVANADAQSIEASLKRSLDVRGHARSQAPAVNLDNIKYLSQSILHEMQKDKTTLASSQKLFEYCDSLIKSIDDQKKLLSQKFDAERISYQHEIKGLQLENERYRQQIEDLHVLVKILEQKK